ncbi:MAG: fasciclin domain-containing protein [Bacteroidota bacterium]
MFSFNANAQCNSSHKATKTSYSDSNDKTIVDLAIGSHDLSTLVAAVKAAGLVEILAGNGPFTVFAPTNEAFAALPAGTVESLLKPENKDQLVAILTYHVVPGRIESTDLSDGQSVATVQGQKIGVQANDSSILINNAQVKKANLRASNGVVHLIDRVILPPKS